MLPIILIIAIACVVISYLLVLGVIRLAKRHNYVDLPGQRRSHLEPTPVGGGMGIVLATTFAALLINQLDLLDVIWLKTLIIPFVGLAVLGWLDDVKNLSISLRLLIQTLVVLLFLIWGIYEHAFWNEYDLTWKLLVMVFFGFFSLWFINAFNFMDGINGLAGAEAGFISIVLAWVFALSDQWGFAGLSLVLFGSVLGFLPLNWTPARIFMGDVGSVSLGFMLSSLFVLGVVNEVFSIWSGLILFTAFNVDTFFTLINRMSKVKRWYTPHRSHLYQWLVRIKYPHEKVTQLFTGYNVLALICFAMAMNMKNSMLEAVIWFLFSLASFLGWYFYRKWIIRRVKDGDRSTRNEP